MQLNFAFYNVWETKPKSLLTDYNVREPKPESLLTKRNRHHKIICQLYGGEYI